VRTKIKRSRSETGASAPEYALITALIAAVVIVSVALLGTTTGVLFDRPCDELASTRTAC
jgi:Flp pilus assembly pilin Flp